MTYRCIRCGFWTGPRVSHWINDEGLCRSCSGATEAVVAARRPEIVTMKKAGPLLSLDIADRRQAIAQRTPRMGVVAALVMTLLMLFVTTLPAQPQAYATDAAPVGGAAPVEAGVPSETPAEEVAVVEGAPVEEAIPAEEAAPAAPADAPTFKDSSDGMSVEALDAELSSAHTSKARTRTISSRVSKKREGEPEGISCSDESLLSNWSLVPTRSYDPVADTTTFTWELVYTEDGPNDLRCGGEGISHIEITVCVEAQATDGSRESDAELLQGTTYTYKWDQFEPVDGDTFSLIYDGDVAGGGPAGVLYKKAGQLSGATSGPACPCSTWTLTVNLSNATADIASTTYTSNPGTVTGTATALTGYSSDGTSSGATTAPLSATFSPTECSKNVSASFLEIEEVEENNGCGEWTVDVATNGTVISPSELVDKTEVYSTNPNGTMISANAPANHSPATDEAMVVGLSDSVCSTTVTMTFTENQRDCSGDFDATNNGPNGDCTNPAITDCNGDVDATNNGPNGDCTVPQLPDCSGDLDPTNNGINGDCTEPQPAVADVCPNMDGDQAVEPDGFSIDPATGGCEPDEAVGGSTDPSTPDGSDVEPEAVLGIRLSAAPAAPEVLGAAAEAEPQDAVLPFTGTEALRWFYVGMTLIALGSLLVRRPAGKS